MGKETFVGGDSIEWVGGTTTEYLGNAVYSSGKKLIVTAEGTKYFGDHPEKAPDIDDDKDEEYNDYQLLRNGIVRLIKDRGKGTDRLIATSGYNRLNYIEMFTLKQIKNKSTLIKQMTIPRDSYLADFKPMSASDVAAAYTDNVNNAVDFFNFLNKNTDDGIEFGLGRFLKNKDSNNYLITTQHAIDTNTKGFMYMKSYIGGYNNLIAFYHNHDGYNGEHPKEVGNQWSADQETRKNVYKETLRHSSMLPRFFTVHEGLGNILIEINKHGSSITKMKMTAATVLSINKVDYDSI